MSNTRSTPSAAIVLNDSLDGELKSHPARQRIYAWRSGIIPKYSSLWIVLFRFSLLNCPDFRMLKADLVVGDSQCLRKNKYIEYGTAIPLSTVNKKFLAEALGEPYEAFQWSLVSDFPYGLQEHVFRGTTSICLSCIKQGFHTAIFSSLWLSKCPIHSEKLINQCPNCGKNLGSVIRKRRGFTASICECANQWMSFEKARKPPLDPQRDDCIGSIIAWMEHASKRCWTYLPRFARYNAADAIFQTVSHGLAEFGESMPSWLNEEFDERYFNDAHKSHDTIRSVCYGLDCKPLSGCSEKSVHELGAPLESLSRLSGIKISKEIGFENVWEVKIASLATFKSMRRYFTKQLLGNRIHLIYWVASNHSCELFRKKIEENKYVIVAWAILYWMRSSIWRQTIVEKWMKRLLVSKSRLQPYESSLHQRNRGAQRTILFGAEGQAAKWIEAHVNAAALLDLWPTQEDLIRCSTNGGFIDAMRGTPVRPPIEWWAWRNEDNRLRLAVMQRTPKLWHPIGKRPLEKTARVADFQAQESLRQLKLHEKMIAPAINYISVGVWEYDGDLSRYAHGAIKRTRLFMGNGCYHPIGIAKFIEVDDNKISTRWILRCLDIPLVVISINLKWGFARLRRGARFYLESCEKSQGFDCGK